MVTKLGLLRENQFSRFSEEKRESLLREMHWWKDPPESWVFLKPFAEDNDSRMATLKDLWLQIGFLYEAEARFESESLGEIRWNSGNPFGRLSLSEACNEEKRFGELGWAISTKREAPAGDWSEPIRFNLHARKSEVIETLWNHLKRERQDRGIKLKAKEIPWNGLEAFDRRFVKLPAKSSNDAQSIGRARRAYLLRHV